MFNKLQFNTRYGRMTVHRGYCTLLYTLNQTINNKQTHTLYTFSAHCFVHISNASRCVNISVVDSRNFQYNSRYLTKFNIKNDKNKIKCTIIYTVDKANRDHIAA